MRGLFLALLAFTTLQPPGLAAQSPPVVDPPQSPSAKTQGAAEDAGISLRDEARQRELRMREKEYAKLDRLYTKLLKHCRNGDRIACRKASGTWAEMQLLLPQGSGSPS